MSLMTGTPFLTSSPKKTNSNKESKPCLAAQGAQGMRCVPKAPLGHSLLLQEHPGLRQECVNSSSHASLEGKGFAAQEGLIL